VVSIDVSGQYRHQWSGGYTLFSDKSYNHQIFTISNDPLFEYVNVEMENIKSLGRI